MNTVLCHILLLFYQNYFIEMLHLHVDVLSNILYYTGDSDGVGRGGVWMELSRKEESRWSTGIYWNTASMDERTNYTVIKIKLLENRTLVIILTRLVTCLLWVTHQGSLPSSGWFILPSDVSWNNFHDTSELSVTIKFDTSSKGEREKGNGKKDMIGTEY